jgi:VWFA-related protein
MNLSTSSFEDSGLSARVRLLLPAFALLLLAAAASPAAAQTPDPSTEVFVDTVEVHVVQLEVSVVDKGGNPIRGLTREDFLVTEDGEEVELSNFYAVESAQRLVPAEDGEAPAPGAPAATEELPPDQRLNLAVVIDNQNISPPNRKRAMDQLRDELYRVVRTGDQVMVIVLDPLPRIEQTFTDDLDAVDAALDRVGRSTAGNVSLEVQRRQILVEFSQAQGLALGDAGGGGGFQPEGKVQPIDYANAALGRLQSYAAQAEHHMRRSYAGIEALVASLGGLPSRKAVLYVSDGIDTNPALAMFTAFVDAYGQDAANLGVSSPTSAARQYDLSEELLRVTRAAAANRVVFYTLDAQGARSALAGPEFGSITPLAGSTDLGAQDTLMQLAAATGGSAMLNPSNVRLLVDVLAQDHSDYYSLGYVSDKSRDGEFHRVDVRVPGVPGARVRHTEGYRGKNVQREMEDLTLSALVLDVAKNPLEVRIELGEEQREEKNRYVLPVLIKVPISKLALVPQDSQHRGKLTVYVAVRDDGGGLSAPQRFEVPVDIPNEQLLNAMSREVGYGVNLLVRGGPGKLAVGVRDDVAAVESTVNLNIDVGEG